MWSLDKVRAVCLSLPETDEALPFGPGTHVFRVAGKLFVLCDTGVVSINLKADPDEIPLLREQYRAVQPGYHMDKKHWNTILLDDRLSDDQIEGFIHDSYQLVVKGLKKVDRERVQQTLTIQQSNNKTE